MLELARSPARADRDRLLLALADLCEGGGCEEPQTQALVREIFMGLVGRVEHDIRVRLAWKLAHASWAPHELVLLLARSEVDIARPLIAASPVLNEQDLIHLLVAASIDHQVEVARRPQLDAAVVTAILDQASPEVLTALAGNTSAQVTPLGMERLVSLSQTRGGAAGAADPPSGPDPRSRGGALRLGRRDPAPDARGALCGGGAGVRGGGVLGGQ